MSPLVASPREQCALLADYQPVSGAYDELFTATDELHAHFVPLVRDLDRLGAAELKRPTKKSELIRAGIAVLKKMSDNEFLAAVNGVQSLKTGRPKLAEAKKA